MRAMRKQTGFTIVELLIVIVVIAILAAITIVTYTGVQTRVKVTKSITDLTAINKIIKMYHTEHGSYPSTPSNTWVWSNDSPSGYIPGVVPNIVQQLPVTSGSVTGSASSNTYGYRSDGTNYKIMAHADDLCEDVQEQRPDMVASTSRVGPPCWAY